ncbi:MAG: hypothetical protein NVS3B20_00900 [Polyangiales bacterium]
MRIVGSVYFAVAATAPDVGATPSARLVYLRNAGTESCPDETSIRGAVVARLGYDPFFLGASETMFMEISRDKDRFVARIKLVDENNIVRGTRELAQVGSCEGMIDAMALSMSIAIDPNSLTRRPPRKATPTPDPDEASSSQAPEPPATPTTSPVADETEVAKPKSSNATTPAAPSPTVMKVAASRNVALELLLTSSLWFGAGLGPSLGGEAGGRLHWTKPGLSPSRVGLSIGASLRGDAPSSRTMGAVVLSSWFLGGALNACGHFGIVSACGVGTVGRLAASSTANNGRNDAIVHPLVGASVGLEVPISASVRLLARALGNYALFRQNILLNETAVYEVPRFSAGFQVGVLVRMR